MHKISKEEYEARKSEVLTEEITAGDVECFKLEKVPFDKENLVLTKSQKTEPQIKLDMNRLTMVASFNLPLDIQKEVQKEKMLEQKNNRQNKNKVQQRVKNNINLSKKDKK